MLAVITEIAVLFWSGWANSYKLTPWNRESSFLGLSSSISSCQRVESSCIPEIKVLTKAHLFAGFRSQCGAGRGWRGSKLCYIYPWQRRNVENYIALGYNLSSIFWPPSSHFTCSSPSERGQPSWRRAFWLQAASSQGCELELQPLSGNVPWCAPWICSEISPYTLPPH